MEPPDPGCRQKYGKDSDDDKKSLYPRLFMGIHDQGTPRDSKRDQG
jgi:hypothetical protein